MIISSKGALTVKVGSALKLFNLNAEGFDNMGRRAFNRQYKIAVAKLVQDYKIPVGQVARELSIHYTSLHRWICEYIENGESAFARPKSALTN